nr:DUF3027 domain-containing protein [Streptomyces boncukensis]
MCAEAVDLAREALCEVTGAEPVGEWIEAVADPAAERVVTHFFESREPGYRGWRWAVTVARASRAKHVTVDESVLLPGPEALLAPEWVPWSERLRPGDLGPGDLLPTDAEDLRLEPGIAPEAELSDAAGADADAGTAAADADAAEEVASPPSRGAIAAVADEIGIGRTRVLSRYGLHAAADRWEEAHGPKTAMAQSAPANCVSCGFLVPLEGSLRQAFGICANEYSPADGQVVSLAYGCGGHSEAAVMPRPPQPAPPVVDETRADPFSLGGPTTTETQPGETG